jgi:hypothetical protein
MFVENIFLYILQYVHYRPIVGISLYRVKSTIGKRIEGERPLLAQFKNELREVARLEGIPVKKLPKTIQTEINKLFIK